MNKVNVDYKFLRNYYRAQEFKNIISIYAIADLKRASPVVPEPTTGGLLLNSIRRPGPHGGGTSIASLSSIEDDPRIVGGKSFPFP